MSGKQDIFKKLREAIEHFDSVETKKVANEVVERGIPVYKAIDLLSSTLREIGNKYGAGEIFLPELMMAGNAMEAAMEVLEPELLEEKKAPRIGTVVIGQVKGDIHDIGRRIVGTLLLTGRCEVVDLGNDVSNSAFAEAVQKYNADILALSATMTITMPYMKEVIEYFKATGIRENVKIIVGGGQVTSSFVEEIGADGTAADAPGAVELVEKLLERK